MPGKLTADVVFCIDSSASMAPLFDALRANLGRFVEGLRSAGQSSVDLRVDFVSHTTSRLGDETVVRARSIHEHMLVDALYAPTAGSMQEAMPRLFTADLERFRSALAELTPVGDETNLVALDLCLDFPWRPADRCHRVVVLLTDEPLETGLLVDEQREHIRDLIEKIHALGVLLFIVGPQSVSYDALAAANRSTYDVVPDGGGLASVELGKVLNSIGRSVSASRASTGQRTARRALFGQDRWQESQLTGHSGA